MLSDRYPVLSVCPVRNASVMWPNGWMDQNETWHAGRPRPHCVTWGLSSPAPKGAQPPIFGPYLLWPNGWMDQDATWYGGRPQPRPHCVTWEPAHPQRCTALQFRPMSIVAKWSPISATAEYVFYFTGKMKNL